MIGVIVRLSHTTRYSTGTLYKRQSGVGFKYSITPVQGLSHHVHTFNFTGIKRRPALFPSFPRVSSKHTSSALHQLAVYVLHFNLATNAAEFL